MELFIKQKIASLTDKIDILDGDDQVVYQSKRNAPTIKDETHVTDAAGTPLYLEYKGRKVADGVRLLYEAPRRGTADSRINFIHPKDAGGVLIELVQAPAEVIAAFAALAG